jgi:hypothetical protein
MDPSHHSPHINIKDVIQAGLWRRSEEEVSLLQDTTFSKYFHTGTRDGFAYSDVNFHFSIFEPQLLSPTSLVS